MGKFMPLHFGHIALIRFAMSQASCVSVAIVAKENAPISIALRMEWLQSVFEGEIRQGAIKIMPFEHKLPHDGAFGAADVAAWCHAIEERFPKIDVFVSSEAYGHVLSDYMHIDHLVFDHERTQIAISGTEIRQNPLKYRDYLPEIVLAYYQEIGGNIECQESP